jgi:membrane protease YdiL (CAAX protease family)
VDHAHRPLSTTNSNSPPQTESEPAVTNAHPEPAARQRRLGTFFERNDGADFPFYAGQPIEIAAWKWLVMILAAVAGFLALTMIPTSSDIALLGTRILFVAIPLVAFIAFTGKYWRTVFRPLHGRDLLVILVFWAAYMVLSSVIAILIRSADPGHVTANQATDGLDSAGELVFFYVGTFIQLFGEELFSLIPFLALLYFCYTKFQLSRTTSIVIAWVLTAIWFGAAHLPTYDWNFLQCFLVIGLARIVLTLVYIRTKNILVAFGTHLLVDWGIFTFTLIAAGS